MTWSPFAPLVGASEEVIRHHADQHACGDVGHVQIRSCPCGRSRALCCPSCGEPVFVASLPGLPCQHLAEVLGGAA